jgi:hypothetical protein
MSAVPFYKLWANHPSVLGKNEPCSDGEGKPAFMSQCAIRMGLCLESSGISLASFAGQRCWHGHSPRHILRAQELAEWLDSAFGRTWVGVANKVKRTARAPVTSTSYSGKTGIVFLMNFWGTGGQGDHIDLWNGHAMAQGSPTYFGRSQSVWFWKVS